MVSKVNNKIIKDVLASFRMDFIEVPNCVVERVSNKLLNNKEKTLVLKKENSNNDGYGRKL